MSKGQNLEQYDFKKFAEKSILQICLLKKM